MFLRKWQKVVKIIYLKQSAELNLNLINFHDIKQERQYVWSQELKKKNKKKTFSIVKRV